MLEADLAAEGLRTLYDKVEIPLVEVLADTRGQRHPAGRAVPGQAQSVEMDGLLAESRDEPSTPPPATRSTSPRPSSSRRCCSRRLKLPPQKRTDKGDPSTDFETLEKLAALGHELPRKIIEHRSIAKLKGTYVDALPELVNPDTGRLHTSFNQTVAATGRLSSTDPNLQNVPARTEHGQTDSQGVRAARAGWRIVTADYSQVELRLLAHFCQDERLLEAFAARPGHPRQRGGGDFQSARDGGHVGNQRRVAKTVNFGVIYGMSASRAGGPAGHEAEGRRDLHRRVLRPLRRRC